MMPSESDLKIFIAFSAIISVIVGAIINYFFSRSLKSREVQLKLIEKLIDKRLKAYEDIIGIAKLFRITGDTKEIDENGIIITYPAGMQTRDLFENLRAGFAEVVNNNAHWLNIDLLKELNYVQDYLGNLDRFMNGKDDAYFPIVGLIVKDDFTSITYELEKIAYDFITNDVTKLKSAPTRGYHKYPSQVTLTRLSQTQLHSNLEQIKKIGATNSTS